MRRNWSWILVLYAFIPSSPCHAGGTAPSHVSEHVPPQSRPGRVGALHGNPNYAATISGTLFRSAFNSTFALQYEGACRDRGLGNWQPQPVDQALARDTTVIHESCKSGNDCSGSYDPCASTFIPPLWRLSDAGPNPITGTRSLWCGTTVQRGNQFVFGYPSSQLNQLHMLYIDTGIHAAPYSLTFQMKFSCAMDDYIYLIGGGDNAVDPLGNSWPTVKTVINNFSSGNTKGLVRWRGSIKMTTPHVVAIGANTNWVDVNGAGNADPDIVTMQVDGMPAANRALYFVFVSNNGNSSEDTWRYGQGQLIDDVTTSDGVTIFLNREIPPSCTDLPGSVVLQCAPVKIVSRTETTGTDCMALRSGSSNQNDDFCSPGKSAPGDSVWKVAPLVPSNAAVAVESCTFPVPVGTGAILATWSHYLDIPEDAGFVQYAEYRYYKYGLWSSWRNTNPSGAARSGNSRTWATEADELAEAAQADSVQLRYWIQCVPWLAADHENCPAISVGLYYDNFGLFAITGVSPAPVFGIFPGSMAQTTFVDGTIKGTNCQTVPCWPGIRGTDLGAPIGINDNMNCALGDSMVIQLHSPLLRNGMGMNWRHGFDRSVGGGLSIAHTNATSYNPMFDVPRVVYRLFDPMMKVWSPWDSTALDADDVFIEAALDTMVMGDGYRTDWPPRDKIGLNLPGGFTVNGIAAYASLAFMPRGSRVQYYFKAVDVQGNVVYQFQGDGAAGEMEDLPTLPGSAIRAPDIMEWRVLPGVYPAGPGGSLLTGRTSTPILDLDGSYTGWSSGFDPVSQALRGLGVRRDRYRLQQSTGYGNNVGGHETVGRVSQVSNFFPNYQEYPLVDSLAAWYRIMIQSADIRATSVFREQDAITIEEWWRKDTGSSQGDRCLFLSGDDVFNAMLNVTGLPITLQTSLARNVFGVNSATGSWTGTGSVSYPVVDDRFAASSAGPALAPAGTFTYPADGGCRGPNRFDALTRISDPSAQNFAFFPNAEVAGVARSAEMDVIADKDRNKALAYGFSINFARDPAYGPTNANYVRSGIENRMRILYKFLTSCRAARTGAAQDSGKCWPCPSPGSTVTLMQADWAGQSSGFQTSVWGPLYPIQAGALATAVEVSSGAAPGVNRLSQNQPNPFNPETAIPYSIAKAGPVTIRIYDISGRLIRTLREGYKPAGAHVARWNGRLESGSQAASGIYFYRIEYPDGGASARKMTLLR